MAFLVAFSCISYLLLHIRDRTLSEYSDRMGMCATDTESLKQILRRCGFSSVLAAMVALSAVVVVVVIVVVVATAIVVDVVDSLNVPSSLYFKGSCVIWEKLILGRMFSLSTV